MTKLEQKLKASLKRVLDAIDKYGEVNEERQNNMPRDTPEFTEWELSYREAKDLLNELESDQLTIAHK